MLVFGVVGETKVITGGGQFTIRFAVMTFDEALMFETRIPLALPLWRFELGFEDSLKPPALLYQGSKTSP